jgi:hypothetical protein
LRRTNPDFGRWGSCALALSLFLGGCSAGAIVDKLPSEVSEPADTPARPATPYAYPAVHDMPPPRAAPIMTEDQQVTLEKDLEAARDHQEGRQKAAVKPAGKKKTPAAADQDASVQDGARTNP